MNTNGNLIETLAGSQMYHDYERAYNEATGMPMSLRSPENWQLPFHGKRKENPFCAVIASKSSGCAGCLQMQEQICKNAGESAATLTCTYGLSEVAVPVRLGNETVGFLQAGQVLLKKPTEKGYEKVARRLAEQGFTEVSAKIKEAYFKTPIVSSKKLASMTYLLSVFADLLSIKGNQIALQEANAEPPVVSKAKQYIQEHYSEDLSLGQVAAAVHTSSFYFCKIFKKGTGMNYTEFVSRIRSEKAKNLLLNPNLRVSEIAYEVGFQSLTHFNRIFKKITGQSPTEYRTKLPHAV